jgi:hypothetical protein
MSAAMWARIAMVLAAVAASAALSASPAGAARLVGRCGANVCSVDPATKKVTRLTHNGSSAKKGDAYTGASVSRSGRRSFFWFGGDPFLARGDLKARHKAEREGLAGYSAFAPTGTKLLTIESIFYPNICPIGTFSCGSSFTPTLVLRDLSEAKPTVVALHTVIAGWVGNRLFRDEDPDSDAPQRLCVLKKNTDSDCDHPVAEDSSFAIYSAAGSPDGRSVAATMVTPADADKIDLDGHIGLFAAADGSLVRALTRGPNDANPAFSPDGRLVAYNHGRDLYVVRTNGRDGGRGKRVARDVFDVSWASR